MSMSIARQIFRKVENFLKFPLLEFPFGLAKRFFNKIDLLTGFYNLVVYSVCILSSF